MMIFETAWRDFLPGNWNENIDVRDFIQKNYAPYEGDGAFLAPATERTKKLFEKLSALFSLRDSLTAFSV